MSTDVFELKDCSRSLKLLIRNQFVGWLVGWRLTSLLSTDTAILETIPVGNIWDIIQEDIAMMRH